MSAWLNRRGATLPLTILMLGVMGVAVAITYARLASERRTTSDAQAQMQAFAVAQSGLSRYLSTLNAGGVKPSWPPLGFNSTDVTYNDLPGGTATVSLTMVRDSTTGLLPAVYAITSRGVNTTARRFSGSAPPAERTVATYAHWVTAPFDLNGAFTSLNGTGVRINGSSARLSGVDRCGGGTSIPGVSSPNAQYDGNAVVVEGNPAGVAADLGTPGAGGTAKDQVDIDWAGIRAGTTLPADFVSPAWPTSAQFANWPVTRVSNDAGPEFLLPSNGKGILIVTGNLRINGALPPRTWEGVVLVGGTLLGNGASNIYGAVMTGLNVKVGMAVPDLNDLGNGTKIYQYDSCALTRALGRIGSIQRIRNGWFDTWPSY